LRGFYESLYLHIFTLSGVRRGGEDDAEICFFSETKECFGKNQASVAIFLYLCAVLTRIICNVRQFELYIRLIVGLAMTAAMVLQVQAQQNGTDDQSRTEAQTDSIEIGLITCSPHEEVYSLYGHSALRYRNLRTGEDAVFRGPSWSTTGGGAVR